MDCNIILAPNLKIGFFSHFFAQIFYNIKKEDKKTLILDRVQKRKIDSKKQNKGRQNNNIKLNKRKGTNKGGNTQEERKYKGQITPYLKNQN